MPEETAVIEAPEIIAPETPEIETPEAPPEFPAPEAPETPEEPITASEKDDGRAFAGKLRDHYKKLLASQNPEDKAVATRIKDLFFADKQLREKFPGGLNDVLKLRETYEQLGAPEEIQEARADAEQLKQIDEKWLAADPGFIDDLVSLNPESFKKLAPVALTKFAQVDPEGYQRVMSGIMSSTLTQAKLGDQLYLINYALSKGDVEEARALVGGIKEWMTSYEQSAKAPVTPPADPRATELDQRSQQLEEREAEMFNRSLTSEFNGWRDSLIKSAFTKAMNGQKIDPERYEIAADRVRLELSKMLPQDFPAKWERLYAQKDKDALLKFAKSPTEANLSKAVAKVAALLFPQSKPKAPVAVTPPANGKPPDQGWVKITARPQPQDIDRGRNRTTDEMIFSGKAILRDGRKVQWDRV